MQPEKIEQIKEIIQPILDKEAVELIDLAYRRQTGRNILRILADMPGGITLDVCARLNQMVGAALEAPGFIDEHFLLEVSSPGLDRPLVTKRDFQRHTGEQARLILKNDKGGTDIITGEIKEAGDEKVVLDIEGVQTQVLFTNIIKARLEIRI